MKQVDILRNGLMTNRGKFETQEELDSWISGHISNNTFGFPERTIPQSDCSEIQLFSALELISEVVDENGEVISPAMARLPAEYTIEITDISAQIEQEKINAEAKKFLSETDWKVIRHQDQKSLDIATSLNDEEFMALLNERQLQRQRVV